MYSSNKGGDTELMCLIYAPARSDGVDCDVLIEEQKL